LFGSFGKILAKYLCLIYTTSARSTIYIYITHLATRRYIQWGNTSKGSTSVPTGIGTYTYSWSPPHSTYEFLGSNICTNEGV
jgi:hypothetical protein